MSLIKLINFSYKDYEVGSICDFGEEKNKSLVSLRRAVYVNGTEPETKPQPKTPPKPKKLITNTLKDQVETAKQETITTKASFWDRLK